MSLLERMANENMNSQRAEAAMAFIIKRRLQEWCSLDAPKGQPATESVTIRLVRLAKQRHKE